LCRLEAAQPVPFLGVDDAQFDDLGDPGGVAQGGEPQDRPPPCPFLAVLARLLVLAVDDVVDERVPPRRQLWIPVHLRHPSTSQISASCARTAGKTLCNGRRSVTRACRPETHPFP